MKKGILIGLILWIVFNSCNTSEQAMDFTIKWNDFPSLPPADGLDVQPGLAGAVTGLISDELLLAGGSNFPDSLPWFGGTKTYYDDIFFINLNQPDSGWKISEQKLPEPVAYSACTTINSSIYYVGGENGDGPISKVYRITNKENAFLISELTALPKPISNAGITSVGNTIYIVGGIGETGALADFYSANILDSVFTLTNLPDLPVAISNSVVVSQWDGKEDCIYVLGGRNKAGELTTFYSSIWKYSPSKKEWNKAGEITSSNGQIVPLAAGTGAAFDKNYIFLFGGDNGILFNKTEDFNNRISAENDSVKKQILVDEKVKHLTAHQGFCKDIFVFNTFTNQCNSVGETPSAAQVTTSLVKRGYQYFIPNGEIRPGVRTPEINEVHIEKN